MDPEIEIAKLKCQIADMSLESAIKDRQIELLTRNVDALVAEKTRSLRAENKRLKEALIEALVGRIKKHG